MMMSVEVINTSVIRMQFAPTSLVHINVHVIWVTVEMDSIAKVSTLMCFLLSNLVSWSRLVP